MKEAFANFLCGYGGYGGGTMFDFFFFSCGFGGCGGGGLVAMVVVWFFNFLFLQVWWLWWWIGDYDGGSVFYFVCGFGCVCVGDGGCGGCYCWSGSGGDCGWMKDCCGGFFYFILMSF